MPLACYNFVYPDNGMLEAHLIGNIKAKFLNKIYLSFCNTSTAEYKLKLIISVKRNQIPYKYLFTMYLT